MKVLNILLFDIIKYEKKIKSTKVKLYHKLINNKLIYDNKPLNRYKIGVNIIPNMSLTKNKIYCLYSKIKLNQLEIVNSKKCN